MGYLAELNQTIKELPGMSGIKNAMSAKSIAKASMDGTFQFSLIASQSNPVGSTATMSRTLERTYAAFMQIVLSLNSTIDISVDATPADYLKRIHRNIMAVESADSLYVPEEDYDEFMEKVIQGKYQMFVNESADLAVIFNVEDKATYNLVQSHKNQLNESLGFINVNPIPNVSNSIYYESNIDEEKIKSAALDGLIASNRMKATSNTVNMPKLLNDKEAKKLNDMQPYTLAVRLMAVNDKKEFVQFMDFAVGVKVVTHSLPSEEMCANIATILENKGAVFNFIRWTSGEVSLFKDLIFNINNIKLDVANRSKGISGWWSTLKRMQSSSKAMMTLFSKYKMVPNATIMITRQDVDFIKSKYGFDMMDASMAKKLMESLFLMTFVIVDDAAGVVNIIYDGQSMYQTYSLDVLEKETASNNGKISKEIMRMIGNR